jgi:hypothetical protein
MFTVKITPNDKGNPPGKLADVELQFTDGPLGGLKLIGFSIWERRGGSGRNVTFPARQYSVNGERRSFALLRPIVEPVGDRFAVGVLRDEHDLPRHPIQPQLNDKAGVVAPFGDDVLIRGDEGDIRKLAGYVVRFDGFLKGNRQSAPEVVDMPVEHCVDQHGVIAVGLAIECRPPSRSRFTCPRQIGHCALQIISPAN